LGAGVATGFVLVGAGLGLIGFGVLGFAMSVPCGCPPYPSALRLAVAGVLQTTYFDV
jgi:hypothetical protein